MRLIDAYALINELNNSHYPGAPYIDAGISIAIGKVCDAPTIEPERKKGQWICSDDMYETAVCSVCKWDTAEPWGHIKLWFKFCPHCGAKMEEGGQE